MLLLGGKDESRVFGGVGCFVRRDLYVWSVILRSWLARLVFEFLVRDYLVIGFLGLSGLERY